MIILEEHKYFEYERKQNVVPFDIAVKAVEEALNKNIDLKSAWEKMEKSLKEIDEKIINND